MTVCCLSFSAQCSYGAPEVVMASESTDWNPAGQASNVVPWVACWVAAYATLHNRITRASTATSSAYGRCASYNTSNRLAVAASFHRGAVR